MIRCIAVDDESLALDLLEDNIRKVPFLELVKRCSNAFEAFETLKTENIDLIFLDIQMPDICGIQFLKSLSHKPMVIFTTAYEKYALAGYDLDVIDYLLKPFSFERFLKAVNKAQEYMVLSNKTEPSGTRNETAISGDFIFVRADYRLVKIQFSDILYIEGLKDYIKIYCGVSPVITLMSMKSIEEKLPSTDFIRVHRSYIVNLRKIQFIEKNQIRIGNREIPVSDNYHEAFFKIINPVNKTNE
ncbi:MAG: LytTR family DNA-binding domain-containing protein [Bacteroidota bacterium]|nr:LytTR family DNA-binding domain-containing protein [Bacteroidota bacterium]